MFLTAVFFSLGLTAVAPPSEPKLSGCIKVDHCKCLMRDGSGLIDLASVADTDGFVLRFEPLGHPDLLLSFSPCLPIYQPGGLSACNHVAACVIAKIHQDNTFINQYLNYGQHEGSKFSYNDSNRTLTVSYSMFPDGEPQTVVHYRCSSNQSISSSLSLSADTSAPLHVWVDSPCACPSACALLDVGPGTIFLIILCLSVTAYFIIGSCALRPFRTGNGVQMSPEDRLWCMSCYQLTERRDGKRKKNGSLTHTL